MKKYLKSLNIILVSIFMCLFIGHKTFAADFKVLEAKTNVSTNKTWLVKFNGNVDTKSISNDNIIVTDSKGNNIAVTVSAGLDNKTAKVMAPSGGYTPGETYTLSIKNIASGNKTINPVKMPFTIINDNLNLSQTINGVTVKVNKIEQDTDSLRLYVTYINNSSDKVSTEDSLSKIVFNKKQYSYDSDFNFKRDYGKNITAPDTIEPNVVANSTLFFKPIANVDKINIALEANFQNYRFDDVPVNDKARGQIQEEQIMEDNIISSQEKDGITVNVNKVVQDSDSLKVYVTYINNTNNPVTTADSLSKIAAGTTQYDYDSDFNFKRYYNQDIPHAQDSIEKTVEEKSVIFFKPVNTDSINIVLNANFQDYNFNNVPIEKQN